MKITIKHALLMYSIFLTFTSALAQEERLPVPNPNSDLWGSSVIIRCPEGSKLSVDPPASLSIPGCIPMTESLIKGDQP